MDSEEHACPVCGQPVETVVRRHKTLGAWVPKWVPGPCLNPRCGAYAPGGDEHGRRPERPEQPSPASPASPASPVPTTMTTAPRTEKT
ncbi:hypothetical protein [Streptomyces sp. enrichment culture]|uniref:hypothetical protein n=1 Tax=Streptomyces sp. enrichment culture TaxID=1795815 RepID=UPI003F56E396